MNTATWTPQLVINLVVALAGLLAGVPAIILAFKGHAKATANEAKIDTITKIANGNLGQLMTERNDNIVDEHDQRVSDASPHIPDTNPS
jgi:hypothetical protein